MSKTTTCHSLCRCTCGDYYEVHVFTGLVSEFEPESHDVDCDHYKAALSRVARFSGSEIHSEPIPAAAELIKMMYPRANA